MKKQLGLTALLLTLAVVFVFGCWAGSAQAADKTYKFSFAIWVPPTHCIVKDVAKPWADEVDKRTEGRVKINLFPGSALGKAPDHFDLAVRGAADIAVFTPSFTPGRFPLLSVIDLPFMTHRSTPSSYAAYELYRNVPEIQAEFSQVKMYGLTQNDPAQLFTVSKPVRSLEDLKGMTIRVGDEVTGKLFKELGATPVFLPMTELYQALERNTIDGCVVAIEACQSFRVHEVTKFCTMIDVSAIATFIAWNNNSWNKLPPDLQKILGEGELATWFTKHYGPAFEKMTAVGLELMKKANVERIELSPEEKALWKEKAMPVGKSG